MAELEELEQEELDEKLLEVGGPSTDNLPSVPVSEPAASSKSKYLKIHVMAKSHLLVIKTFVFLCSLVCTALVKQNRPHIHKSVNWF